MAKKTAEVVAKKQVATLEELYTKVDEDAFFDKLKKFAKKQAETLVDKNFPKAEGLSRRLIIKEAYEQVRFWMTKLAPDNVKAAMRLGFEIFRSKKVGAVKALLGKKESK